MNCKVGDSASCPGIPTAFVALIDDREFRKTGNSNNLWIEIKICVGPYSGMYALGSLETLKAFGWKIGES